MNKRLYWMEVKLNSGGNDESEIFEAWEYAVAGRRGKWTHMRARAGLLYT